MKGRLGCRDLFVRGSRAMEDGWLGGGQEELERKDAVRESLYKEMVFGDPLWIDLVFCLMLRLLLFKKVGAMLIGPRFISCTLHSGTVLLPSSSNDIILMLYVLSYA